MENTQKDILKSFLVNYESDHDFRDGAKARLQGQHENPHPQGSPFKIFWDKGYEAAIAVEGFF